MISAIVAMDQRGLIGVDRGGGGSGPPWQLPRDMHRFRLRTLGRPVIMGRRTYEAMPEALPERLNIVLSSEPGAYRQEPRVRIVSSLEDAFKVAEHWNIRHYGEETVIIGGGSVFDQTIERWDRLYLTIVGTVFEPARGEATFFPVDALNNVDWIIGEQSQHAPDDRNPYPVQFSTLTRRSRLGVGGLSYVP